jgi:mannose-6-phosphate isomerase-like protein (cupin superfamily)
MVVSPHVLPATMGTRLAGPQSRRFLHADHHFPFLLLVVHTTDTPPVSQRQNLMEHFFRYHKAQNLRFTSCPFQPLLPITNVEEAFRVYQSTPPHYHLHCDEYLYVFSGRGTFWTNDESGKAEFCPGQLLFFERGTVHAMPDILEGPVVFLSIDTPRREPDDVHFVNPADGTAASFIQPNKQ